MNSVSSTTGSPTWRIAQAMMDSGSGMGGGNVNVADPNQFFKAGQQGLNTAYMARQTGAHPFGGGINGLINPTGFASGAPSLQTGNAAPWVNPDGFTPKPMGGGFLSGLFGG